MQKKRTNKTTNERKDNKTCKTVKLHLFILTKKNEEERKKNINVMRAKHSFIHSFTNTKKNFLFVRSFVVFDHRRQIDRQIVKKNGKRTNSGEREKKHD